MITKITGTPVSVSGERLTLAVGPLEHEIFIPEYTRRRSQEMIGQEISLHTIEYLEGNPMQGRLTPRLIGFLNAIEREFFELFCQVDGVGVKKALRAMVRPVQEVAAMIEGVLRHGTDAEIERQYVDSHGQSEVAFGWRRPTPCASPSRRSRS